jgi:hypothetical protein
MAGELEEVRLSEILNGSLQPLLVTTCARAWFASAANIKAAPKSARVNLKNLISMV